MFLDKREASQLDFLTVNETAVDPPMPGDDPDNNINAPDRLSLEATMINQNFSQQILKAGNRKVRTSADYSEATLTMLLVVYEVVQVIRRKLSPPRMPLAPCT